MNRKIGGLLLAAILPILMLSACAKKSYTDERRALYRSYEDICAEEETACNLSTGTLSRFGKWVPESRD